MTTIESEYYAFREFDPAAMKLGRSHYVQFFDAGPVLELACGRGEFLGLLAEAGLKGRGVDIDVGMVDAGRAAGHDVVLGEARHRPRVGQQDGGVEHEDGHGHPGLPGRRARPLPRR